MPATARQSYSRMRAHMTPSLQRQLAAQAAADLQSIEERQLSTSFTVRDSVVVASADDQWTVQVSGHRLSWSRATLMSEEDIAYELDIVRARPSDANPAGLVIARVSVGRPPEPARRPPAPQHAHRPPPYQPAPHARPPRHPPLPPPAPPHCRRRPLRAPRHPRPGPAPRAPRRPRDGGRRAAWGKRNNRPQTPGDRR